MGSMMKIDPRSEEGLMFVRMRCRKLGTDLFRQSNVKQVFYTKKNVKAKGKKRATEGINNFCDIFTFMCPLPFSIELITVILDYFCELFEVLNKNADFLEDYDKDNVADFRRDLLIRLAIRVIIGYYFYENSRKKKDMIRTLRNIFVISDVSDDIEENMDEYIDQYKNQDCDTFYQIKDMETISFLVDEPINDLHHLINSEEEDEDGNYEFDNYALLDERKEENVPIFSNMRGLELVLAGMTQENSLRNMYRDPYYHGERIFGEIDEFLGKNSGRNEKFSDNEENSSGSEEKFEGFTESDDD
jgi:hypothetical protein